MGGWNDMDLKSTCLEQDLQEWIMLVDVLRMINELNYYNSKMKEKLYLNSTLRQHSKYGIIKFNYLTPESKKNQSLQNTNIITPFSSNYQPKAINSINKSPPKNSIHNLQSINQTLLKHYQQFQTVKIIKPKKYVKLKSCRKPNNQNYQTDRQQIIHNNIYLYDRYSKIRKPKRQYSSLPTQKLNLNFKQSKSNLYIQKKNNISDQVFRNLTNFDLTKRNPPRVQISLHKNRTVQNIPLQKNKEKFNQQLCRLSPQKSKSRKKGLSLISSQKSLSKLQLLKKYDQRKIKPKVWGKKQSKLEIQKEKLKFHPKKIYPTKNN